MNSLITIASVSGVFQFFWQGGFFMALLLICSIVSVAVMILRAGALKRRLVMPPEIEDAVHALRPTDEKKGIARIVRTLTASDSSLARIVDVALKNLAWPKSENIEAVQTRARHEVVRLESGLFILEIIVGISPLLGLLGAVSGLVHVFSAFGENVLQSDSHLLARGIAEALSTTIVGLVVAIPSLVAYSHFSRKVETMAAEMESLIAELLSKCYFLHSHESPLARQFANDEIEKSAGLESANRGMFPAGESQSAIAIKTPEIPKVFANREPLSAGKSQSAATPIALRTLEIRKPFANRGDDESKSEAERREEEKHETTKIVIDEKSEPIASAKRAKKLSK